MLGLISRHGEIVARSGNAVEFSFQTVSITLIYDCDADRMRLLSPIKRKSDLGSGELDDAMQANFHSVLDARYCVYDDVVWSAFIHPLADLSDDLFVSAIEQVALANLTFGDQYTGGNIYFQG